MNPENIALWTFAISMLILLAYAGYRKYQDLLEDSLFKSFRVIAESSRIGEAPESTIQRLANTKGELSASIFKKVLKDIEAGNTFEESLKHVEKKNDMTRIATRLLIHAQNTGVDIYDIVSPYSGNIWKLKHMAKYAKASTQLNLMIIRAMAIVVLPMVFYFFPFILEEITFPAYTTYFFAAVGVIVAFYDMIVYDEYIYTLIFIPLFASIPILIPWVLGMFI